MKRGGGDEYLVRARDGRIISNGARFTNKERVRLQECSIQTDKRGAVGMEHSCVYGAPFCEELLSKLRDFLGQ